ncbi:plasmid pRiA4b ORF-3 family protein [Corynebacterium sp. AOP40-9SA-29]|uniref:plasmid pRiA4b ORF-3 family protein n=1 Tax=Corynebacterium sp. AOP40-9SA-29 TaxID=3457677 RepID=UPI004033CA24
MNPQTPQNPQPPQPRFDFFDEGIPERRHLRRDPLPEAHTFRLTVQINNSDPSIWREIEVRSDVRLSRLHDVIQAAFLWQDYHLHRFSLGGDDFDPTAELFLCPFDVNEPEPCIAGTPARDVRIDETVQRPGDVLHYLYDYGDNWDLTITLTSVGAQTQAQAQDAPAVAFVAGERAAPPEDCGSRRTAEELAGVLLNLEDVGEEKIRDRVAGVDWAVRAESDPEWASSLFGGFPFFEQLRGELSDTFFAGWLGVRLEALSQPRPELSTEDKAAALSGIMRLLDLIDGGGDGVKLTGSGYLPPAIVTEAIVDLPAANNRIARGRTESKMAQILKLRTALTAAGLLRKSRGHLKLTSKGRKALVDPQVLWDQLVSRFPQQVVSDDATSFDEEVTPLALLSVATTRTPMAEQEMIADLLTLWGWETRDGNLITGLPSYAARSKHPMMPLLDYIGPLEGRDWSPKVYSEAASALAREVLCRR